MTLKEALALLGVQHIQTQNDVETARINYRNLLVQWHPDRNPGNLSNANQMTDKLVQAWRRVKLEAQKLEHGQSQDAGFGQNHSEHTQSHGSSFNQSNFAYGQYQGAGFGQNLFEAEFKELLNKAIAPLDVEQIYSLLAKMGIQSWVNMAQIFGNYKNEREFQCAFIATRLNDSRTRIAAKMIFKSENYQHACKQVSNPEPILPAAVFVNEIMKLLEDKAGSEISCYVVVANMIKLGVDSWQKFEEKYPDRNLLEFDFALTRGAQVNQTVMAKLLWEYSTSRKERAERERAERLAREQAAREKAERLSREQAARERAERLAREQAERERAERLAREQAARERAERLAREQAARERAERLAREQAERERAERSGSNRDSFFAADSIVLPERTGNFFRDIENLLYTNGIDKDLSQKIAHDPLFVSTPQWEFMNYIFTNIKEEADLFFMFSSFWAGNEDLNFSDLKRISRCFAATPEFQEIMNKSKENTDVLGNDLMNINAASGQRLAFNLAKIGVTSWPLLSLFLKNGEGNLKEKFARYQLWDGISETNREVLVAGIEAFTKLEQSPSIVNVDRGKYWGTDFINLLVANGISEHLAKKCGTTLAGSPYYIVSWYVAKQYISMHSDGNKLFSTLAQALGGIDGLRAVHLQQIIKIFASQEETRILNPQVTNLRIPDFDCNPPKDKILSWEQLVINLAREELFSGYSLRQALGNHKTTDDLNSALYKRNAWTGIPEEHREALAEALFNTLQPKQGFRHGH